MCGITLFNHAFLLAYPQTVLDTLNATEDYGGRDGCGLAVMSNTGKDLASQVIWHDRGPNLHAEECFHQACDNPGQWYLFHSRIATTARKSDGLLNQPFISEKADLIMAHVGTIGELDVWSQHGNPVSDGYTLFHLATHLSTNPVVDLFRANIGIAAGWYKNMPYLVAKQGSILPASVGEFCYSSARIEQAHTIGIDTFYHGEDKLLFLSQERNMLPLPTRGHTRYKSMGWTYQTASDLDIDPAWERHVPTNSNDPITHVPVTNTELRDTMLLPTSHETVNELLVKKLAADIHAINVVSGDSYIGQQTITSVNSNVSNVKQSISTNDSKQKHFISTFTEMFDSIKKEDK